MIIKSLPGAFEAQMQAQLGNEFPEFKTALNAAPSISIRFNPLKINTIQENQKAVKWFDQGVYLEERPIFTLDPLLHAGVYYVQEASSMFVAEAVRQVLDLQKDIKALDLCAAPGGKSTLLSSILTQDSLLIANEVIRSRYQILQENITKWGSPNVQLSNADSRDFAGLEHFFDLVVVDAPCSGEGLFRKDEKAMQEWSPAHVEHCSARQKRILADAAKAVKPDGILIYCTCTYNDTENEYNAKWLSESFDIEPVKLSIPPAWNIISKEFGYQFYPHRVQGEGFYIACFRKKTGKVNSSKARSFSHLTPLSPKQIPAVQQWLSAPEAFQFFTDKFNNIIAILKSQVEDCQIITQYLRRTDLGLELGTFKGKDFVPAHALALSTAIAPDLPAVELDKEQALHFLKKDNIILNKIPESWALARYQGHNLGWLKGIGNRINNYFPKNWRILMDLPSDNF
ncbi:MAG: methyltransferase RsmF C-terminal domain-like protein [Saprospiraceae bacterium]